MARDGAGTYSLPSVYSVQAGDTIQPEQTMTPFEDIEATLNTARPVSVGGTGATTAAAARTNLSAHPITRANDTTGSANAYALASEIAFASLTDGDFVLFVANHTNTGAATLNVDGLGAKDLQKTVDGTPTALASGDIDSGGHYLATYDASVGSGTWIVHVTTGAVDTADLADGAVTTVKIAGSAVTYAKMQDVSATDRILGRVSAGAGVVEELAIADAAAYRAKTADRPLTAAVWDAAAEVALSDATTIAVDMSTFINATVTLAGNRTLGNPTNPKVGQSGVIRVVQDATGSRTLAFDTNYEFAGGTAPTLTTTANAEDLLFYHVISATRIFIASALDIS